MLGNCGYHVSPIRPRRPGRFPTVCADTGHGHGGRASSRCKRGLQGSPRRSWGRPISLVVPTSLSGKVARVELHNDSLAQITSQHTLPRRAGELYPEDIEPGGFYGMKLFEKLYNHLYKTIHDDEARKRMSLDSVARRNGIIPARDLDGRRAPPLAALGPRLWQPEGAIDASGEGQAFAMIVLGIKVAHARAPSNAR